MNMQDYDNMQTAKYQSFTGQSTRASGAILGGHVGEADAPVDLSPFTMAGMTFAETQDMCQRIGRLADRLCGAVPTPVSGGKSASDVPFVLPALRQMSGDTLDAVRSANEALSRIERSLP
jgi:hypothetical protein